MITFCCALSCSTQTFRKQDKINISAVALKALTYPIFFCLYSLNEFINKCHFYYDKEVLYNILNKGIDKELYYKEEIELN